MVITIEPLKIEFVDRAGEVAVVLNENSQLVVEPLRARREKISDDDEEGNKVEVVSASPFLDMSSLSNSTVRVPLCRFY